MQSPSVSRLADWPAKIAAIQLAKMFAALVQAIVITVFALLLLAFAVILAIGDVLTQIVGMFIFRMHKRKTCFIAAFKQ